MFVCFAEVPVTHSELVRSYAGCPVCCHASVKARQLGRLRKFLPAPSSSAPPEAAIGPDFCHHHFVCVFNVTSNFVSFFHVCHEYGAVTNSLESSINLVQHMSSGDSICSVICICLSVNVVPGKGVCFPLLYQETIIS